MDYPRPAGPFGRWRAIRRVLCARRGEVLVRFLEEQVFSQSCCRQTGRGRAAGAAHAGDPVSEPEKFLGGPPRGEPAPFSESEVPYPPGGAVRFFPNRQEPGCETRPQRPRLDWADSGCRRKHSRKRFWCCARSCQPLRGASFASPLLSDGPDSHRCCAHPCCRTDSAACALPAASCHPFCQSFFKEEVVVVSSRSNTPRTIALFMTEGADE